LGHGAEKTRAVAALLTLLEMTPDRLAFALREDSRIGFEASNQYYYVPVDLMEKVLNCRDLLARTIPK